jgi:cysteine desulfurase/selenocysteine lyase
LLRDTKLAYLDSAASTQKPGVVIDALNDFYANHYANVHRGVYDLSEKATEMYENARGRVARFINAAPEEVVFVKNATEAVNLVAYSFSRWKDACGDVLATIMEHHSNFVPWQQLARIGGRRFRVLSVGVDGKLDLSGLRAELENGVRMVAVTHVSNVLGTVNPVKEIAEVVHEYGSLVLVDGAQSVAHMPVDVKDMGVDFFAFSGHKMYGPDGIGVLYARRELLEEMPPFLFGGDMISEVRLNDTRFNEVPYKFEAGTPPVAEAVGLAEAVNYIEGIGFEAIIEHEVELLEEAWAVLASQPGVNVYGPPPDERIGVLSFNLGDVHPHDVAGVLNSDGVCIRAGHHCAQPLHDFLGVPASARVSLGIYNSSADIELLGRGLDKVKKILSRAA